MKHINKLSEYKTEGRFKVVFPKQLEINDEYLISITEPTYIDGKWCDIELTFLDPIGPSQGQLIFCNLIHNDNLLVAQHGKLFSIELYLLDQEFVEVSKWDIDIEKLSKVEFGKLKHNSVKPKEIKVWLKPKECILRW